jgi:hypothetical protein
MTIPNETYFANGQSTDTANLLNDVVGLIRRYVVLGDDELVATALWVVHTHLFRVDEVGERNCAFEQTPYLAVSSAVPGCGKSLFLEVLEPLVARPWMTGGLTAAVLVRKHSGEHVPKCRPSCQTRAPRKCGDRF